MVGTFHSQRTPPQRTSRVKHRAINWSSALSYERALRKLIAKPTPALTFRSFAGLSAIDAADLPKVSFLSLSDDYRLGYRHYTGRSNVHVILVHGAGCFGDQLHTTARQIAQSNHANVYTLNLRGHGHSDGERGHAVDYHEQLVDDVAEFIAAVRARDSCAQIVLAGHSAGGGVVLAVSRETVRSELSGIVFLAPYVGLGSNTIRPHFGGWVKVRPWAVRAIMLANLLGIKRYNHRTIADFNVEACLHDRRFVRSWSFNTVQAFGPGRWLAKTTPIPPELPVLLITGAADECFDQSRYQAAFEILAPHAECPNVGASGHWGILVHPLALTAFTGWLDRTFPQPAMARQTSTKRRALAA